MFNFIKKKQIINRAQDEILYECVLEEIEGGAKVKGLWAKAYANSAGDENKIEPLYMQYRVQAIKDSFTALEIMYEELSRKQIFDYIANGFKDPKKEKRKLEIQEEKRKIEHEEKRKIEREQIKKSQEQEKRREDRKMRSEILALKLDSDEPDYPPYTHFIFLIMGVIAFIYLLGIINN